MANKSLGQHFLKNRSALRAIVAALDPQPDETVVEIGPGHGEVTLQMASGKWKIVAIEKDEKLFEQLGKLGIENLKLIHGDALTVLPELITQLPNYPIVNYKIVGNIPYYITGHLLRIIGELPENEKPKRCVFTMQREVAERILGAKDDMSRLAASVGYWADAKIVMRLEPEDFSPVPNVSSAVIVLDRKPKPAFSDQPRYYEAVRALFAQPRKTILNNLAEWDKRQATGDTKRKNDKENVALQLKKMAMNPTSRPQNLRIEDIAEIAESFF